MDLDRLIDALGDRTFPFALQLGAGEGELTERLAPRCGRLITLERSAARVEVARSRLETVPNVDVRRGVVPEDLPVWTFDLVVCAAVPWVVDVLDDVERVMPRAATLLAAHPPSDVAVHDVLRARFVRVAAYADDALLVDRFERREN